MEKKYLYLLWCVVILYIILIFTASSSSELPKQVYQINDKVLHFIEYFILASLLVLALIHSNIKHPYLTAICITICFAAFDEFHQLFVSGRTACIFDFLVDCLAASTILLVKLKKRYQPAKKISLPPES